nr:putative ADP-ribosylation factor [Tanacetum cinerariifolium]
MIYGSDLVILSAYAPLMPPLLSLLLSMACDDSDGCVTVTIHKIYRSQTHWKRKCADYFRNTQKLIFMVNSNGRDRVVEAKDELHRMLNEEEFGLALFSNSSIHNLFAHRKILDATLNGDGKIV